MVGALGAVQPEPVTWPQTRNTPLFCGVITIAAMAYVDGLLLVGAGVALMMLT
jgi:hypothetical protein